jgi:magnesium chelatase family protein
VSFSRLHSAQCVGLRSHIVDVEIDISNGLHTFTIVGLPDKAVEESRDRVSSAIKNTGFESPKSKNHKVIVSLAPADIKKEGPLFDLPIALGYLLANSDITFNTEKRLFVGELSLDGVLRPIKGMLLIALAARKHGFTEIYVPEENAEEAALVPGIAVYGAHTLKQVVEHINEKTVKESSTPQSTELHIHQRTPLQTSPTKTSGYIDFKDVKGQEVAKRALLIAAAGGHNVGLFGPPGTGKTMLCKAFKHLLPPLTYKEVLETTGIHSVSGSLEKGVVSERPFRSPHHTSSYVSVIGGGTFPKPGEVTLAHRGVLFLDEFPEFDRRVVEALRQPLEDKVVTVARAKGSETFPANFILVVAMNPCPCGNFNTSKRCTCTPHAQHKYQQKISGPIIDRIDMWIKVDHITHTKLLSDDAQSTSTSELRQKIERARTYQTERFTDTPHVNTNSDMDAKTLTHAVTLSDKAEATLNTAASKLGVSPRGYHRIIKVSRTIADLDDSSNITEKHVLEALQYRAQFTQS